MRCGISRWLALLLLSAGPAMAQDLPGDPVRGRAIADRWCIACHEVAPGVREPSLVEAPTFQQAADDPAVTETALRAFFQTPHHNMPDVRPTPQEKDDLIAYILSLKRRTGG
jgi:mono/diheme cytochrome c family protein